MAARVRRQPARWLWPALGLTLAVAFACGVAAEGTIADRAARATLAELGPLQRAVTVTDQQPVSSSTERRVRSLLSRLGLPAPTRAVLLNPVRLSGRVVGEHGAAMTEIGVPPSARPGAPPWRCARPWRTGRACCWPTSRPPSSTKRRPRRSRG